MKWNLKCNNEWKKSHSPDIFFRFSASPRSLLLRFATASIPPTFEWRKMTSTNEGEWRVREGKVFHSLSHSQAANPHSALIICVQAEICAQTHNAAVKTLITRAKKVINRPQVARFCARRDETTHRDPVEGARQSASAYTLSLHTSCVSSLW